MITNPISSSRLKKSGLRRSIIGASAIGSMGAALKTANAEIIHSGAKNLSTSSLIGTINVPDLEPVDLSGHGTKGPEFSLSSFNNKGFDFHTLSDMGRFDHFAPIIVEEISLDLGVVRRLEKGDIIDSQRAFVNDSPTSVRLIDNNPNGQWTGGTDGYFGYRFDTLGFPPLYGWGRVTLSADAKIMTLVEWAYDGTGAPIRAGLPEPTAGLLLAVGLAIAALFRRRTSTISVSS